MMANDDARAIRALQIAYGRKFDERDADGFAAIFFADAVIRQHTGRVFLGSKARSAVLNMPPPSGGFHRMLATDISVNLDEAEGRCEFVSRTGDGRYATGYYDDTYRRTATGWKITARTVNITRWIEEDEALRLCAAAPE